MNVYRGEDHFEEVASASIVPGDVIVVPTGNKLMACDAVLVTQMSIKMFNLLTLIVQGGSVCRVRVQNLDCRIVKNIVKFLRKKYFLDIKVLGQKDKKSLEL